MDEDDSGTIELQELIQAYTQIETDLDQEAIERICKKVDIDGNNEIEYSEFVAHCLTSKQLTSENIKAYFKSIIFKPNRSNQIPENEEGPSNNQG